MATTCRQSAAGSGERRSLPKRAAHPRKGTTFRATLRAAEGSSRLLPQGAGAEMRVALGVAVFSGMIGVTLFGIYFTPVLYVVVRWFAARSGKGEEEGAKALRLLNLKHDDRPGQDRSKDGWCLGSIALASRAWRAGAAPGMSGHRRAVSRRISGFVACRPAAGPV